MVKILHYFRSQNKSIFASWLTSYLAILLIPILVSGVVYYETSNVIKSEINRANAAVIKQVAQVIDGGLRDVERLSLEVSINEKIKSLLYVKNPLDYTDRYLIGEVVRQELAYGTAGSFVKNFYLFYKKGNFVLRQGAYYEPELAHEDFHGGSGLSYKDWQDKMQGNYNKSCFRLGVSNNYSSTGSALVYMQSFPVGTYAANFVVLLNESYINEILANLEWVKDGSFYIIDKENRVLLSNDEKSRSLDIRYDDLNKSDDIFYDKLNGESVAVSYVSSKILNWKFVSVFPEEVFMEKADYARKITLISLLFCMLVGAAVAFVFTKRNYNPVHELVTVLKKGARPSLDTPKNEYQFIRDAIHSTLVEKEEIGKKLELQSREMFQGFLARLLRGRISSHSLPEMLESYGLDFSSGWYAVMLFNIEDYRGFFKDEPLENEENMLELVEFSIINVVEELARKNHQCQMVEMNGRIAGIVNLRSTDREVCMQELFKIAMEAQCFTRDSLYVSLTISVSNIHETVLSISEAYQEALEALEYKMVVGSGEIIRYDEIHESQQIYYYPLETEMQLVNNIKTGNFEKAQEILNEIFNLSLQNRTLSLEMARCLMFDLASTVVKTLNEFNRTFDKDLWQEIDPVANLLTRKTIKEMKAAMEEIVRKVCSHIDSRKESHNTKLKEDILDYIENHFTDINLSNSIIAEKFSINTAYLSRFFKEQMGEGIPEYVNKLRLEKAKQLLKEDKANIGDIAGQSGFYNHLALIRAFKKYEGITPGKYKET